MTEEDKVEYRRLLDEIGEDYCPRGTYCIFKEFLISSHPSRRLLIQLKCVDKRKFIKSKESGKDVGWDTALKAWVSEGHAELFAKFYTDKRSANEIFNMIIGLDP